MGFPLAVKKWNFNPTLVQFKRWDCTETERTYYRFQSYISPIQTHTHIRSGKLLTHFNPTLVQFKRTTNQSLNSSKKNFNPTLVQFKPKISIQLINSICIFQSYISPIQTSLSPFSSSIVCIFQSYISPIQTHRRRRVIPFDANFNPTLVQFKPVDDAIRILGVSVISILH